VKSTVYPLHSPVSPSLPLPCVTVCHHISTGLYLSKQNMGTSSPLHIHVVLPENLVVSEYGIYFSVCMLSALSVCRVVEHDRLRIISNFKTVSVWRLSL